MTTAITTDYAWSPQQSTALLRVAQWLNDPSAPQVFTLFGFAGTGKTTLARFLAGEVQGLTLFGAYTGKAASVLRKMGCAGAQTLHSMLYSASQKNKERLLELEQALANAMLDDPEGDHRELKADILELRKELAKPIFTLQEDSVIRDASLVVVDECSMINKLLGRDLESFGKKLLVMGDPGQLPPVEGGGYYSKRTPDVLLTEIHRQAAENPILRWATAVREGKRLEYGQEYHGEMGCKKVDKRTYDHDLLVDGSQLLAGKNATRRKMNQFLRKKLGHTGLYPKAGERLVVLQNDRDWGVLNGVTCEAVDDAVEAQDGECLGMNLLYEGNPLNDVPVNKKWFDAYRTGEEPIKEWDDRWMMPLDFGYCLTVHKAQGSQWDAVTLCDDGFGSWDPPLRRQWLYTAITRAQTKLTIVA